MNGKRKILSCCSRAAVSATGGTSGWRPAGDGILRSQIFPGLSLDPAALLRGDQARVIKSLNKAPPRLSTRLSSSDLNPHTNTNRRRERNSNGGFSAPSPRYSVLRGRRGLPRIPIANCELQIANCKLQIANFTPTLTSPGIPGEGIKCGRGNCPHSPHTICPFRAARSTRYVLSSGRATVVGLPIKRNCRISREGE